MHVEIRSNPMLRPDVRLPQTAIVKVTENRKEIIYV